VDEIIFIYVLSVSNTYKCFQHENIHLIAFIRSTIFLQYARYAVIDSIAHPFICTRLVSYYMQVIEYRVRNYVFTILSYNRDDHAKNFSFLMDDRGTWRISPAYDLIFSSDPNGEHYSVLIGEGKKLWTVPSFATSPYIQH